MSNPRRPNDKKVAQVVSVHEAAAVADPPAGERLEQILLGHELRDLFDRSSPCVPTDFQFEDTGRQVLHTVVRQLFAEGVKPTPDLVASRVFAVAPGISESTTFEYLKACMAEAPTVITPQDLERQVRATVESIRLARNAMRRRQADDMLRASGIEALSDATDILQECVEGSKLDLCLSLEDWLQRDIPPPDRLLGDLFTTTSRLIISAPTGLGKTNFTMAAGLAMAAGSGFLHWRGHRPARVLFIDGEMSNRLHKRRLQDAARRYGGVPAGFYSLCRDDVQDMSPLCTTRGQAYIDSVIERIGGVDFLIPDNVMSLIGGDMKDEESWSQTLPWIKRLTQRQIGQCWIHHTGGDKTKSYGTSTREWQMDTSALMEDIERPGSDVAFTLKFLKARERTPDNRGDFEPVVITLTKDEWSIEAGSVQAAKSVVLTRGERGWLADLTDLFATAGATRKVIPASGMTLQETLTREQVRDGLKRKGRFVLDADGMLTPADRQRLSSALIALKDKGKIGMTDHHVWLLQERQ